MTLLPKVKLKTLVNFPAQVNGGTGIDVTKNAGVYAIDLDYSEFGAISTIPSATSYTLTYDTIAHTYVLVPVSLFSSSGSISDAPVDGLTYGRNSAAWARSVAVGGDTMTGSLTLNANPSTALGAAPKQYVDLRVLKAGDTMTGSLVVASTSAIASALTVAPTLGTFPAVSITPPNGTSNALVIAPVTGAAAALIDSSNSQASVILDKGTGAFAATIQGKANNVMRWDMTLGNSTTEAGSNVGSRFTLSAYNDAGTLLYAALTGYRETGLLEVKGVPTTTLGIATKGYVDAATGTAPTYDYDTVAAVNAAIIPGTINYIRTAGYYAIGDKGGARYKRSVAPAGPGKFQSSDGAWWEITEVLGLARQFGAKGDNINNDATAINDCLAKYLVCHLDEGIFRITAPITLNRDFAGIRGISVSTTTIMVASTSINGIANTIGLTRVNIQDLHIDRVISGTPTGNGLSMANTGSTSRIYRVKCTNHANGFVLGPTDDSLAYDCEASENFSNGFLLMNMTGNPTLQWSMQKCIAQRNNAVGFIVSPQITGQVSVGTLINCSSFGNGQGGLSAIGTATRPIQGLRVLRCFFGEDNGDLVFLDTYGTDHHFDSCNFELAGRSAAGRGGAIAASNLGSGVQIGGNNNTVYLTGCSIGSNSRHGIQTAATLTTVTGCVSAGNGQNGVANSAGIILTGGTLIATGNILQLQHYGIFLSVDAANILGGRIFGNSSGTITGNGAGSTITAVRFT